MRQRSVFRHPALRWAAPAAAVVVVAVVGVGAAAAASADDHPVLPERTAEQLLTDVQQPTTQTLSGTVALSADLGLPALPGLTGAVSGTGVVPDAAASAAPGARMNGGLPGDEGAGQALDGLTALLAGDHTLRVWVDGPERSRVALIGDGEESDLVRDGQDVWLWQSSGSRALHATLPPLDERTLPTPADLPDELLKNLPSTPQEAASMLLSAADPTTEVSVDATATVAGRAAYQLVATPRTAGSLVARVVVAVDAETHVPLRLDVYSTQRRDPAFSIGFTSISYAAPDADVFAFTPPAGATVTELPDEPSSHPTRPSHEAQDEARPDVTTVGTGWATVVVAQAPAGSSASSGSSSDQALGSALDALPALSGPWGSGHGLSGTLFSVLVTDDGRVAAGAVSVPTLEDALAHAGTTP